MGIRCEAELSLVVSIAKSMGVNVEDRDIYRMQTRPIVNFGLWTVGDKLSVSVSMLFPDIFTSSFVIPDALSPYIGDCLSMVDIVDPSSGNRDGFKITTSESGQARIVGRLSSSVAGLIEHKFGAMSPDDKCRCTFVGIGSSRIIYKVQFGTDFKVYRFGPKTIDAIAMTIPSLLSCEVSAIAGIKIFVTSMVVFNTTTISKYLPNNPNAATDRSYIIISVQGDVRYQGTPAYAPYAFETLSMIINRCMDRTDHCLKILPTLVCCS
jgi:hypothetical protein